MNITVGSRVTFTERRTFRPYLHSVTGTVTDLLPWMPHPIALVELDNGLMPRLMDIRALRVVEEQEGEKDALAVHPRPFELLCEDYDLMTGEAGNLGGTEYGAQING